MFRGNIRKSITLLGLIILTSLLIAACSPNQEKGRPVSWQVYVFGEAQPVKNGARVELSFKREDSIFYPRFNPSMDKFVVSEGRELWLYSSGGKRIRRIFAAPPGEYLSSDPEWSPQGDKLFFTTISYPGNVQRNSQITAWLVDLRSGATPQTIFRDAGVSGYWSPDGKKILFTYGNRMNEDQATLFDLETGKKTRIGKEFNHIQGPLWSPDGNQLAFVATGRFKTASSVLTVYDLSAGDTRTLAQTLRPYFPKYWSKDSRQIYFETGNYGGLDLGKHQVGVIDVWNKQERFITFENLNGPMNYFAGISPDEKILLFSSPGKGKNSGLWQHSLATGKTRQVADNSHAFGRIYWAEGNKKFYSAGDTADGRGYIRYYLINPIEGPKWDILLTGDYRLDLAGVPDNLMYFLDFRDRFFKSYILKSLNLTTGEITSLYQGGEKKPVNRDLTLRAGEILEKAFKPEQVEWITMKGGLPGFASKVLFPEKDLKEINKILNLIGQGIKTKNRPSDADEDFHYAVGITIKLRDGKEMSVWPVFKRTLIWRDSKGTEYKIAQVEDRFSLKLQENGRDVFNNTYSSREVAAYLRDGWRKDLPPGRELYISPEPYHEGDQVTLAGDGFTGREVRIYLTDNRRKELIDIVIPQSGLWKWVGTLSRKIRTYDGRTVIFQGKKLMFQVEKVR